MNYRTLVTVVNAADYGAPQVAIACFLREFAPIVRWTFGTRDPLILWKHCCGTNG